MSTRTSCRPRFLQDVFAGFGINAEIIPNIVDVERFRFRDREHLRPRILSTRNFETLYNLPCTLRAFRLVQDWLPRRAADAGRAPARRTSAALACRGAAARNVTFAGRVPPDDIWRYYAEADLYLQTPDIDNMPSSVLEAFASGCPVVANGRRRRAGDPHERCSTACSCPATITRGGGRDDPADRGRRARLAPDRRARETCTRYQWSSVRAQWLALYRRLVRPRALAAATSA